MKALIAYDGSTYADAAIDDLPRAGLPRDSHILVASAADVPERAPAQPDFGLPSPTANRSEAVLAEVLQHEAEVLEEARLTVERAAERVRTHFPAWTVQSEVLLGEPTGTLLKKIEEWRPDLAIGGSQGRSALGRFFLGSVSKAAAENAGCSIRIVRRQIEKAEDAPLEIVLAVKNPGEAERIVGAVGRRVWPDGTRIRMVAADDGTSAIYADGRSIYEAAAQSLATVCLKVSIQIESGDPKTIFLEAADTWHADCIFVAPGNPGTYGLDETASALVTSAPCTVEVVR